MAPEEKPKPGNPDSAQAARRGPARMKVGSSSKPESDRLGEPGSWGGWASLKMDPNSAFQSMLMDARCHTTNRNFESAIAMYKALIDRIIERTGAQNLSAEEIPGMVIAAFYNVDDGKKIINNAFGIAGPIPSLEIPLFRRMEDKPFDSRNAEMDVYNSPNIFIEAARIAELWLSQGGPVDGAKRAELEQSKNLWWVVGVACMRAETPDRHLEDVSRYFAFLQTAREAAYWTKDIRILDQITMLVQELRFFQDPHINPLAHLELYLHFAAEYSRTDLERARYALRKAKQLIIETVGLRTRDLIADARRLGLIKIGAAPDDMHLPEERFHTNLERLMRWYRIAAELGMAHESYSMIRNSFEANARPGKEAEYRAYMADIMPLLERIRELG